jgi:membrane-bound lytic murein transglycosylase D
VRLSVSVTLALLFAAVPAFAEDDRVTLPVDDPPPPVRPAGRAEAGVPAPAALTPTLAREGADAVATDAPAEGVWAWVARLEGEVLTQAAVQALQERAEARRAEDTVIEGLGEPDVPADVYDDPTGGLEIDPLRLAEFDARSFDIPVELNADVKRWMRYFLGSGRGHFQRYLTRSGAYLPLMQERLEAAGMPRDLVYLAMVESGFSTHALSHAGAAGLWQFMPATARMYDLRVDWWVDERRDPIRATDAAVRHLADLHKMFGGDWYLAWSAYNAGPGRVRRAMQAAGSKDFWAITRGGHLPAETANYTPKILAAAIIAKNAERYGFSTERAAPLAVETVRVDGAVGLATLADGAGVDLEALRELNPGIRRAATPAEGYELRVPVGRADRLVAHLAELPDDARSGFGRHTVARGETLSVIAARHGVTTDDLVRANNLVNKDRIVVGMSLIVPKAGAGLADAAEAPVAASGGGATTHTVKAGESLSGIGQRHGVSTANLRTWNGLASDVIHPGQTLRLTAPAAPAATGGGEARVVRYTVAAGDTLSAIAARYGVALRDLQAWNGIDDPSLVRVGQQLEVRRPRWSTYTVQPGDSLGRIATNLRCSVDDLRAWNDLRADVIHPGQELRVQQ